MMSIFAALDNNTSSRIEAPGYMRVPPEHLPGDKVSEEEEEEEEREGALDSCSSSIGKNSDLSGRSSADGEDSGDTEVQSSYKGPLNAMDSLEEVLPIKRGISKFYEGRSKSFTSLARASSSSIKDLVKPENAYTRKRRNLLAATSLVDGGISKRLLSSSSSSRLAMSNSSSGNSNFNSKLISTTFPHTLLRLPVRPQLGQSSFPLPPPPPPPPPPSGNFSVWRSFSLADLQQCASVSVSATSTIASASSISDEPAHLDKLN
uniref:Uncharacterized protein n=1 Tax=Davidia involucrata TaxID=16924 RepID=A0A5B6ZCX5_DAVIN